MLELRTWLEQHLARVSGKSLIADAIRYTIDLVNAHIVDEHDVASLQSRSEELLDIGLEGLAIHCAFAHEGRGNAVVPQRCDECKSFPVPVQHLLHKPLTLWRSSIEARDRRRNAGFIDEYELSRIE